MQRPGPMCQLPDVNILVALVWEQHLHHGAARAWFAHLGDGGFATCTVTQAGFVRVSSNPSVITDAVSVSTATAALTELCGHRLHRFLDDRDGYVGNPAVPHPRVIGHRQVTDAFLVGLARSHGCRVVTFDRGLAQLGESDVHLLTGADHSSGGGDEPQPPSPSV